MWCRWHDPDAAARARHTLESRRGGLVTARPSGPSIAASLDPAVQLELMNRPTAAALVRVVAAAVGALTKLPLDTRTANSIAQCAVAAAKLLETTDFEQRLQALERRDAARRAADPRRPALAITRASNARPLPGVPRDAWPEG